MNILALDTAADILSIALETETGLWYTEIDAGTRHSELLMESANRLCETAGIVPAQIDLAACMKGPGSFTGLRIGFSAAKGLAIALGIPLVSVPTLDCMARNLSVWPGIVIPVIDAKKDSFYTALYRENRRLTDYLDISAESIAKEVEKLTARPQEPVLLTGPAAEICRSRISAFYREDAICVDPGFRNGRAKDLLFLAKSCIFNGVNDIDNGPVYLRKSDAELNWK